MVLLPDFLRSFVFLLLQTQKIFSYSHFPSLSLYHLSDIFSIYLSIAVGSSHQFQPLSGDTSAPAPVKAESSKQSARAEKKEKKEKKDKKEPKTKDSKSGGKAAAKGAKKKDGSKDGSEQGITAKKSSDFANWYAQVVRESGMIK